jgi:hypothetical protein
MKKAEICVGIVEILLLVVGILFFVKAKKRMSQCSICSCGNVDG